MSISVVVPAVAFALTWIIAGYLIQKKTKKLILSIGGGFILGLLSLVGLSSVLDEKREEEKVSKNEGVTKQGENCIQIQDLIPDRDVYIESKLNEDVLFQIQVKKANINTWEMFVGGIVSGVSTGAKKYNYTFSDLGKNSQKFIMVTNPNGKKEGVAVTDGKGDILKGKWSDYFPDGKERFTYRVTDNCIDINVNGTKTIGMKISVDVFDINGNKIQTSYQLYINGVSRAVAMDLNQNNLVGQIKKIQYK